MKFENQLHCTDCGHGLNLSESFDGCDWDSVEGKGSGFKYEIALVCGNCGRVYPIGRIRDQSDFSEVVTEQRPYLMR